MRVAVAQAPGPPSSIKVPSWDQRTGLKPKGQTPFRPRRRLPEAHTVVTTAGMHGIASVSKLRFWKTIAAEIEGPDRGTLRENPGVVVHLTVLMSLNRHHQAAERPPTSCHLQTVGRPANVEKEILAPSQAIAIAPVASRYRTGKSPDPQRRRLQAKHRGRNENESPPTMLPFVNGLCVAVTAVVMVRVVARPDDSTLRGETPGASSDSPTNNQSVRPMPGESAECPRSVKTPSFQLIARSLTSGWPGPQPTARPLSLMSTVPWGCLCGPMTMGVHSRRALLPVTPVTFGLPWYRASACRRD
jgi:hypothetical protein